MSPHRLRIMLQTWLPGLRKRAKRASKQDGGHAHTAHHTATARRECKLGRLGISSKNGRRYYAVQVDVPIFSFAIALLIAAWSILSIGFLIASLVPTARFAQPVGAAILYPMLALSGLFVPLQSLPPALRVVARVLPLTYAVSLLQGIWNGDAWSKHVGDIAALVLVFVACTALSAKVFRWE